MSQPAGTHPCRRIHSRTSRLIRLRTTAFPTFFVTVMPSRPTSSGSLRFRASARTCRPWSLSPSDWTTRNSARRRSRIAFVMRRAIPTSWRWSPRCACGLSRGGGEGPRGLHGSSCEHGSRACAFGSCYAADTYASRHLSGVCGAGSILTCVGGVKRSYRHEAKSRRSSSRFSSRDISVFRRKREFNCWRFCLAESKRHLLRTPNFLLWTTRDEWPREHSRRGCG